MADLNAAALDSFVYQPVSKQMISYLAGAAFNVIACDSHLMAPKGAKAHSNHQLPPSPPRTPEPTTVGFGEDAGLPTLEAFITQLVVSSNVQVPTLMSTLVYLTRLKSKLQPMARGLRCTAHRIFLAALILAAKYLNDSSPKNKHWAAYSHIDTSDMPSAFGFSRSEVNLMERQLLMLLEWNLRITEEDLYREFDPFLAPVRNQIEAKHHQRLVRRKQQEERRQMRRAQEEMMYMQRQQQQMYASCLTPPVSRENSRSRHHSPSDRLEVRQPSVASTSLTPPPLVHSTSYGSYGSASSSAGSYPSSVDSSSIRSRSSRATTPPTAYADEPYMYVPDGSMYESPVEIHVEKASSAKTGPIVCSTTPKRKEPGSRSAMLPYEVGPGEEEVPRPGKATKRPRFGTAGRNMLERMFFGAVTVR